MREWPSPPRACLRLAASPEGPDRSGRCCCSAHHRTGSSMRRKFWIWSEAEHALPGRLPARIWPGFRERCLPSLARISPSRQEIIAASSRGVAKGYAVAHPYVFGDGIDSTKAWVGKASGPKGGPELQGCVARSYRRHFAHQSTQDGRTPYTTGSKSSRRRLRLVDHAIRLARTWLSSLHRYRGRYRSLR